MAIKVNLTQDIGEGGITAEAFRQEWPVEAKEVDLIIDSCGGNCMTGLAIADFIRAKRAEGVKVHAKIQGMCGSISTVICLACDDCEMSPYSQFFVHESRVGVQGTSADLETAKKELDLFNSLMTKAYVDKTKQPEEKIKEIMAAETLMGATQAKELGFIDRISAMIYKATAMFRKDKPEAEGHVYISINQAEESPGAVQSSEAESEGATPAETPAVEEVKEKKIEEIREEIVEESEAMIALKKTNEEYAQQLADLQAKCESLEKEKAEYAVKMTQTDAFAKKLGEVVVPPRPKYNQTAKKVSGCSDITQQLF